MPENSTSQQISESDSSRCYESVCMGVFDGGQVGTITIAGIKIEIDSGMLEKILGWALIECNQSSEVSRGSHQRQLSAIMKVVNGANTMFSSSSDDAARKTNLARFHASGSGAKFEFEKLEAILEAWKTEPYHINPDSFQKAKARFAENGNGFIPYS